MDYREAIELAKNGKEEGFRFLYDSTYQSKYYLALKYMKNEDDAQDVLQDAYIKAFSKLDTLTNPEAFPRWLGIIVGNLAKNKLQKKNPMSFTDVDSGDEEQPFENTIEDESTASQPEMSYSKQETQELVHELINALSEEQRVCILMYEIEGISIKEIAAALQCSENTVKSRLNYGRKNLRKKAEELQKKGYSLYSIAPVPLLLLLLRKELRFMSADGILEASQAKIAMNVFSGERKFKRSEVENKTSSESYFQESDTHRGTKGSGNKAETQSARKSSGAGKRTVASAAKKGFIHTAAGKVTAVLVAAAVAGGAVYFGVTHAGKSGNDSKTEESQLVSEVSEVSAASAASEAPEVSEPVSQVKEESSTPEPEVKKVADEDYENLIAGNLTKDEFEFVLAYGPQEIPDEGFSKIDYDGVILCGFTGSRMTKNGMMQPGEGIPVEYYGITEDYMRMYSLKDINDLLLSFTDYQFTEDAYSGVGTTIVEGDVMYCMTPSLNYISSAEITSAEYTDKEMIVNFVYDHYFYDPPSGTRTQRMNKKATLHPVEGGKYRIVKIEEVKDDAEAQEKASEKAEPEQKAASAEDDSTVESLYNDILDSIKSKEISDTFTEDLEYTGNIRYFLHDMDKDGVDELVVGAECIVNTVFFGHNCRIYTCKPEGDGYKPIALAGEIISQRVHIPEKGMGFIISSFSRGTGVYSCNHITVEDGEVHNVWIEEYDFIMGDDNEKEFLKANPDPEWIDLVTVDE